MAIRLVAVDLDGTLLDSRSEISPANRRALREASERGIQIVVVTGRRFYSAQPFVAQIPCPVTLVSSNGALVGSPDGKIVHRQFLPREAALEALQVASEYRPYAVVIFDKPTAGQVTMQEAPSLEGPYGWYLRHAPGVLELVPDLEKALKTDPIQLMIGGPPPLVAPAEELLGRSRVGGKIHLSWTKYFSRNLTLLDVNARGCSKAAAVERLARAAGIDASEVMAIGDNFNDLELLRFAGRPVVMRQSPPGLHEDDWAVTGSNDEDGVAAAIQAYVLNESRT